MILYQSTIQPLQESQQYSNFTVNHELACGDIALPVAGLTDDDFEGFTEQIYFDKNFRLQTVGNREAGEISQLLVVDENEAARRGYAIHCDIDEAVGKEGYELIGIDQRIVANRFSIGTDHISIVGREFPELYTQVNHLLRVYAHNPSTGDYAIIRFVEKTEGGYPYIEKHVNFHYADTEYVKNVLSKRTFTGFVRTFGSVRFANKVKIPPKTRIFVCPDALKKRNLSGYLGHYFPGGYVKKSEVYYEAWTYNPEGLKTVIESIMTNNDDPVYQIYFLGYPFDQLKELRTISDTGFDARRDMNRHKQVQSKTESNEDSAE